MFKPEDIENVEKAPKLYLRLCLMFEAYCRGNSCHMESMIKQKEMVNTLTELSKVVKSYALKDLATKVRDSLSSNKKTLILETSKRTLKNQGKNAIHAFAFESLLSIG